ncbi:hypothetical protein N9M83_04795 [Candidatus Poseidonia alphae]|nr:hypothetical protein [Candidatus Poseidonia alphae]MDA8759532.1 hypothetical protein [Candidatus Poseidonia alphae]MDB2335718.1 hypothetical protein [Candidatus Poseidonia alphae]MDB2568813.1 hypothetical protein [Candidatus Poseidonia alphae]
MESSIYGTEPEGANPTGAQPVGARVEANSFSPVAVTVGPEKKPKVPLIIAGVFAVLGVIGLIVASLSGSQLAEIWTNLDGEDYVKDIGTSAEMVHTDEDGQGELGWGIFITGDYVDSDSNGMVDACEQFDLTVMNNGTDVTERAFTKTCDYDEENNSATYFGLDGKIQVGTVCATLEVDQQCSIGETYTISTTASAPMFLLDIDDLFGPLLEESIGLGIAAGGGFVAGCCSMCIGTVALVIGLMRFGKDKQPQVAYQMQ